MITPAQLTVTAESLRELAISVSMVELAPNEIVERTIDALIRGGVLPEDFKQQITTAMGSIGRAEETAELLRFLS